MPPKKTVEQIYQKKSQLEHILLRPDTYVGSIEQEDATLWVVDRSTINSDIGKPRMVKKNLTFVPGLYKIFDEILVNAADNKQRDPGMKEIVVKINQEKGYISVKNDGKGIPVTMHKKQKCYVPEMIFGHLLTSSNYNDTQKKTVGGRNGYGAKLANIFSKQFVLETVDAERGLKYKQTWRKNMSKKDEPNIKDNKGSSYTKITFHPDFKRFGMEGFTDDIMDLFTKRVFDIAGTVRGVKVILDGYRIQIKSFEDYVKLFFADGQRIIHAKISDRWQIACALSEFGGFQNISHVNNIWTIKGGTHVKMVVDQITTCICNKVNKVRVVKDDDKKKGKKKKKAAKKASVKAGQVKNHIFVFVNALIENPAFSSQTKEELTLKKQKFGSECSLPEKFLKGLIKKELGIVEAVSAYARFQEQRQLKKSDGKKTIKLAGIPKLEDANDAGGRYSSECTLILTEGDSAAALARSGVAVVGADKYGVFPLRGKLLNVRDAKPAAVQKNAEVEAIKKILGLKQGADYMDPKTFNSLRYGHLMVMTDQDHDGSHIKGLVCNLIHTYWPTLVRRPGFMTEFITPIVKCTKKGKPAISFHTLPEYEEWKTQNNNGKGWQTKYYKGLGTSTSKEAKEYFSNIDANQVDFRYSGDMCDQAIDLAFSKKKVEARKTWLANFEPGTYLDMNVDNITYHDFVYKELILFSNADNKRSIPCIVDGLKPSQRKVLFCCFKKKLTRDIKVAQFQGYVSEKSAYHHGEVSLQATIVGMAQNFVGSNNINLLYPSGQFGTRHMGGKDSASPRYIFTRLSPITRELFNSDDDCLLNWLDDDGQQIEPEWYIPVIPMVLVNGADGIGTGWSTQIPNYNPRQLIRNIRKMLRDEEPEPMDPWYKGWTGRLEIDAKTGNYRCYGSAEPLEGAERTLTITELPVRTWNNNYKAFLEAEQAAGKVDDIRCHHTDNTVSFTVKFTEAFGDVSVMTTQLLKSLKLIGSCSVSNMVLFNERGQLRKYRDTKEILEDFYKLRLHYYNLRKNASIERLSTELRRLDNKCRFILMICNKKLKISNRKKKQVVSDLECAVPPFDKFFEAKKKTKKDDEEGDEEEEQAAAGGGTGFNYLLNMRISKLTFEEVEKLKKQRGEKEEELNVLMATPIKAIWRRDLQAVEQLLDEHEEEENAARAEGDAITKKARARKGKGKGKGGKRKRRKKAPAKKFGDEDLFAVSKKRAKNKGQGLSSSADSSKPSSSRMLTISSSSSPQARTLSRPLTTNYSKASQNLPMSFKPYKPPAGLTSMLSKSNKAAKKAPAKKAPTSNYSLAHLGISDSSDDEDGGMSLAQRLAARSGFSRPAPTDNKFSVVKKRKRIVDSDSDEENLQKGKRRKLGKSGGGELEALLESD